MPVLAGRVLARLARPACKGKTDVIDSLFLQTIDRSVECTGVGLHGGASVRVVLRPFTGAGPGQNGPGIVFRRVDLERGLKASGQASGEAARVEILASVDNVCEVDHATTLAAMTPAGRVTVGTVEHLLSALHGLGIDSCLIELDAAEVPILDGSAGPWVELVRSAGVRRLPRARKVRRLLEPFSVEAGGSSIVAYPSDSLKLTCSIDFAHPVIGLQEQSVTLTPATFATQVAPARTFGFLREVEALQAKGLVKGGSLDNAIVLDDDSVLNGDLRFADEFVRHKVLDLLGDLALGQLPLRAHVVARRAGHRLHVEFLRQLLATPNAWTVEAANRIDGPMPALMQRESRLVQVAQAE